MSEIKNLRPKCDFYLEYQGKRMLDESLFFILKNLKEGTLTREFLHSGDIPIFDRKLRVLSEFLGTPVDLSGPGLPDEIIGVMEYFEREREGVNRYLRYGRAPALTVDGVIFSMGRLLLIRRRNEPFKGMYALPGGFVEYGERTEDAVLREIFEETGLRTRVTNLIGVYSDPDRDPRGHTVSAIYLLEVVGGEMREGDDAAGVEMVDPEDLPPLAFDHEKVVKDALQLFEGERVV